MTQDNIIHMIAGEAEQDADAMKKFEVSAIIPLFSLFLLVVFNPIRT